MDNDDGSMRDVTDGQPALRPVLRWESVLPHPSFRSFMTLPTPLAPTGASCEQPAALGATMAREVASLLCKTSASFLRPLDPQQPLPPLTHLAPPLRELLEADPDVFAERQPAVARGMPREGNAPQTSIGGAAPVSPRSASKQTAIPIAAAAPKHEQRQRGRLQTREVEQEVESPGHLGKLPLPLSAGAATKQSAVEVKPPPMKKAKLIRLRAGGSKVAAVETPVEEARKLADGFAAFAQQFVRRLEKGASAEQGEQGGEEYAKSMELDGSAQVAEDEEEACLLNNTPSAAARLHREARRLAEEARRVCSVPAALLQVPPATLSALLRVLQDLVDGGRGKLFEEDEQESSVLVQQALLAMEAAVAALHIMTVPGLPAHVYNEDLMESIIEVTRFHITSNAYPFHDARLRAANRPKLGVTEESAEAEGGDGPGNTKRRTGGVAMGGKKKGKGVGGLSIPPGVHALVDRAQAVLGLLADLVAVVHLPSAVLLPLLRAALISLSVEMGLSVLQAKAVALVVAAFRQDATLRGTLFDELFAHVIPYQGGIKRVPREFLAGEEASIRIQMVSATVLQMVQGAMDLPAMDCDPDRLTDCFKAAVGCCEYFWTLCLNKLPLARAQKSDSDLDFRVLLDSLVRDLLDVARLPEWPAAPFMLLRLLAALAGERGLRHADVHVRQACVDLLGAVAARLHADALAVAADASWLEEMRAVAAGPAAAGGVGGATRDAPLPPEEPELDPELALLLKYLADQRRAGQPGPASARRFLLGAAFAEEVAALQRQKAGKDELRALLVHFRRRQEEVDSLVYNSGLEAGDAARLAAALAHASLGKAPGGVVTWLLEAMDPTKQAAPTTRAKAVKALGDVVAADTRVLASSAVQTAVDRALQDEAVSVREAAVALLGRHIGGDRDLALGLFNTVARASTDAGTSVRRSAIKILWECCMRQPGFSRATDACTHVLMRAGDPEESIQNEVAKVFHALWFTPRLETGDPAGTVLQRSASERAQQLAEVAVAVYEAGGRSIHLPLDPAHPLVSVLRAALGWNAKGDLKVEWRAGREISEALLERFLEAEEASPSAADVPGFPYLLSLHAFAVTDVQLCMPAKDPAKFVRSLAPYLKVGSSGGGGCVRPTPEQQRRGAEALLSILSVLDGVLSQLSGGVEAATLGELVADLAALVNRHPFVQVLASASKCLATLAASHPPAAAQLAQSASVYRGWLQAPGQHADHLSRFLFIMAQLCRYGADIIERTPPGDGSAPVSIRDCLALFVGYCNEGKHGVRVAESALQAVGLLTIARPSIMVERGSRAKALMQRALQPTAPEAFKLKALSNLTELLRADEELLLTRQAEAAAGEGGAALLPGSKRRKGHGGGRDLDSADRGAGAALAAVQVQNGEGDTLSQSSSILQDNWEAVLALATDTSAAPGSPPASADVGPGTLVRRRVVELMETVLRGGLVGPWTALSPLMALATDPLDEIRARALRLLRQLGEKHPRYFDADRLAGGVAAAQAFHVSLAAAAAATPRRAAAAPPVALQGLCAVYAAAVQPQRSLKLDFLRALLRRFRGAASVDAAGAADADLALLAFLASVAAQLPYRRGDEPCTLVQEVNALVSTRGESVLLDLRSSLEAAEAAAGGGGGGSGGGGDAAWAAVAAAAVPPALAAQVKASLALSMLLVLKDYLKMAYGLTSERIAAFGNTGEKRKAEERQVVQAQEFRLNLDKLDLEAAGSLGAARAQYRVFKGLMKADADSGEYEHVIAGGRRQGSADRDGAGPWPLGDDDDAVTPEWVIAMGQGAATTGRGRGRGRGRGGSTGRGRGRGRGRRGGGTGSTGGRGKKRKRNGDSDSDDSGDSDFDPRKRL